MAADRETKGPGALFLPETPEVTDSPEAVLARPCPVCAAVAGAPCWDLDVDGKMIIVAMIQQGDRQIITYRVLEHAFHGGRVALFG